MDLMDAEFDEFDFGATIIPLAYVGMLYAMEGNMDMAKEIVDQLLIFSSSRLVSPLNFAGIYMAMGDIEYAKVYLEKSLKERDFFIHDLQHIAPFYLNKEDPWIRDIIRRSWKPLNYADESIGFD